VSKVPVLALTATATGEAITAIRDIEANGCATRVVRAPMARSNLHLSVRQKADFSMQDGQLLLEVQRAKKPCLMFLNSQHRCERKAEVIRMQFEGLRVSPFHAGMSVQRRNMISKSAMCSELDVLCCTVSFGMGVNVRVNSVIHWELPVNIECYVQAIGRAGKDGSDSQCTLFWNRYDVEALKQRARNTRIAVDRKAESVLDVERNCALTSCGHK
jgi:ATP-dependent DNA helicase RecQ